jgi:hypothetical protein
MRRYYDIDGIERHGVPVSLALLAWDGIKLLATGVVAIIGVLLVMGAMAAAWYLFLAS